jgi:hypothetical protein
LFLSSTAIGGQERTGPGGTMSRAPGRYNGVVATAGGEGSGPDETPRRRPTFLTDEAKAVLFVWSAVTLVLIVTYVLVLLLV